MSTDTIEVSAKKAKPKRLIAVTVRREADEMPIHFEVNYANIGEQKREVMRALVANCANLSLEIFKLDLADLFEPDERMQWLLIFARTLGADMAEQKGLKHQRYIERLQQILAEQMPIATANAAKATAETK